ncbi:unnamed protein product [Orchesella dallaii]|uniref:Cadherin domain-containing protein n=1 Tax=Orchesella dallaii TaxID=48710 RepID=A0ABP1RAT5_9HEXA
MDTGRPSSNVRLARPLKIILNPPPNFKCKPNKISLTVICSGYCESKNEFINFHQELHQNDLYSAHRALFWNGNTKSITGLIKNHVHCIRVFRLFAFTPDINIKKALHHHCKADVLTLSVFAMAHNLTIFPAKLTSKTMAAYGVGRYFDRKKHITSGVEFLDNIKPPLSFVSRFKFDEQRSAGILYCPSGPENYIESLEFSMWHLPFSLDIWLPPKGHRTVKELLNDNYKMAILKSDLWNSIRKQYGTDFKFLGIPELIDKAFVVMNNISYVDRIIEMMGNKGTRLAVTFDYSTSTSFVPSIKKYLKKKDKSFNCFVLEQRLRQRQFLWEFLTENQYWLEVTLGRIIASGLYFKWDEWAVWFNVVRNKLHEQETSPKSDYVNIMKFLSLKFSHGQECPFGNINLGQIADNEIGIIFDEPYTAAIVYSVSIFDETFYRILESKIEGSGDDTRIQIRPKQPAFTDTLDKEGIDFLTTNQGLVLMMDDGTTFTCSMFLRILDTNNQPPVFNRTEKRVFSVPSTWDTNLPLNWDFSNSLQVIDQDFSEDNANVIIIENEYIRGQVRPSSALPPNSFMYDVLLFLNSDVPASGVYSVTASDGVNEASLDIEIIVTQENLYDPVFRETGYQFVFDEIPQVGDDVPIAIIAFDPDTLDESEISYSVADNDYLEYSLESQKLFFKKVDGLEGKLEAFTITATEGNGDAGSTDVILSLKFPEEELKFKYPSYVTSYNIDWPSAGVVIRPDLTAEVVGGGEETLVFTPTNIPPFIELVGDELRFSQDVSEDSEFQANNIVVFDVMVTTVTTGRKAHATFVVTFPLMSTTTTTDSPPESTTTCDCPAHEENLHDPVFKETGYHVVFDEMPRIREDVPIVIHAFDPDSPDESNISYSVADNDYIAYDIGTGTFFFKKVDGLEGKLEEFTITATEGNGDARSTDVILTLKFPESRLQKFNFKNPYYLIPRNKWPSTRDGIKSDICQKLLAVCGVGPTT